MRSRREEIHNKVLNIIQNATHPPTETNVLLMMDHFNLNASETNYVKEILPPFFGSTSGIFEAIKTLVGYFPLDSLMLILEFKGKDKIDIYYGNFRVQGNQIKKLAVRGGAEVCSYSARKFEQFGPNPMESMLQVLCLDFAVFYNGNLVYAKGKGEGGVDINEMWRLISKFEISEEQQEKLKVWKTFVSEFNNPPLPEVPYDVWVSDEREECLEICHEIAELNRVPLNDVELRNRSNKKIFIHSAHSSFSGRMKFERNETIDVDLGPVYIKVSKNEWLSVSTFKKYWNPDADLSELRKLLNEMFKNITGRWANHLLKTAKIEGVNPFKK